MSTNETMIPFLKKDAVIPIEVGQVFVGRLNSVLLNLVQQRKPEDMERLKEVYEKKETPEDWMEPIVVIQSLLQELHTKATELGMIEMKPVTDVNI